MANMGTTNKLTIAGRGLAIAILGVIFLGAYHARSLGLISWLGGAGLVLCLTWCWRLLRQIDNELGVLARDVGRETQSLQARSSELATARTMLGQVHAQQDISFSKTLEKLGSLADLATKTEALAYATQRRAELTRRETATKKSQLADSMQQEHLKLQQMNETIGSVSEALGAMETTTQTLGKLALNARTLAFTGSLEAARAGERGRGMATVADELGKLAETMQLTAESMREQVDRSLSAATHQVGAVCEQILQIDQISRECNNAWLSMNQELEIMSQALGTLAATTSEQSASVSQLKLVMTEFAGSSRNPSDGLDSLRQSFDRLLASIEHEQKVARRLIDALLGAPANAHQRAISNSKHASEDPEATPRILGLTTADSHIASLPDRDPKLSVPSIDDEAQELAPNPGVDPLLRILTTDTPQPAVQSESNDPHPHAA